MKSMTHQLVIQNYFTTCVQEVSFLKKTAKVKTGKNIVTIVVMQDSTKRQITMMLLLNDLVRYIQ